MTVRGALAVVLLGGLSLGVGALTGCGSSGSGGGGGTTTQVGAKSIYMIQGEEEVGGSILEFAVGSEGNAALKSTLTLPSTFVVLSVATDSVGQIYVGGYAAPNFEILVYPAGSSGAATPTRTISTAAITDAAPVIPCSLTTDSSDSVYVAGCSGITANVYGFDVDSNLPGILAVYSSTANGATAPTQLITSAEFTDPVGIAVDGKGNIYLSNQFESTNSAGESITTGAIYEFLPGSTGAMTPFQEFSSANVFWGVAVDSSGNVYANELTAKFDSAGTLTITSQIDEFAAGYVGVPGVGREELPTKTITIPNGGNPIAGAFGLRVDSTGNLFTVVELGSSGGTTGSTGVMEFGPTASGNATPITNFAVAGPPYLGAELAIE